ncbi:phospholipase D-like domain-containing protein [Kordiimonas lacus]|uniref:Phospholipase D n=1 Tax=Kordiimonas lacus TaxID=637679 RepID=A0A1G7E0R7_9PROT|nr:phospholipase D-like domain-containing protein [Kordiimonas lacus]SDE57297.1 PLD-like domain-containing protein [Kordiimonas lacus]
MTDDLISSSTAKARLVVTMPPTPSKLSSALEQDIASNYVTFTRTTDAFTHIAASAAQRLIIMIPFIDRVGADWALDLFEQTPALERILILRDAGQLTSCGKAGARLQNAVSRVIDYGGTDAEQETFHAKIVLADGVMAYVGSANLLRRSKTTNLECGILLEGPAVHSVKVLTEAVIRMADGSKI